MEVVENAQELMKKLDVLFTNEFMQKYTRHESFESFKYSSAVFVNWDSDPILYNAGVLDCFVKECTVFLSWESMVIRAVDEDIRRRG